MTLDNETHRTWDKIASVYEEKFMDFNLYNDTYDFFLQKLPTEADSILEIGCGPGNITQYLLKQYPNFKILGIDVAPSMIQLAKKNNPSAEFKVMDARKIDLLKVKYNGIIAGFCIPYFSKEETEKFILDCKNLLLENGILYLSFVPGSHKDSGWKSGNGNRVYFHYYEEDFLKRLLKKHHFKTVKEFQKDYPGKNGSTEKHSILIAERT